MSVADRLAEWLPLLWYLLALAAAVVLWMSGLVPGLIARMRKFGGFGVEFEFSEESARQTRDTIEAQMESVRRTIRRELEADVRARSMQHALKAILETRLGQQNDYRATIHIQDPLYDNWLYQLLDYHPTGSGHGRTFSTRGGIVGLAWRMGTIQQWNQGAGITKTALIRDWGMTDREAAQRRVTDSTKVMLAAPLTDPSRSRQIGVLYLDSSSENCFGSTSEARLELAEALVETYRDQMARSLSELVESALRRSPQLSLESS